MKKSYFYIGLPENKDINDFVKKVNSALTKGGIKINEVKCFQEIKDGEFLPQKHLYFFLVKNSPKTKHILTLYRL